MNCSIRQIRFVLLAVVGLAAAHLPASAQVRAFTFKEHGRMFLTSPTYWMATGSGQRNAAGDKLESQAPYVHGSSNFLGLSISGQYLFHGLFVGYGVGVGCTPKADINAAGNTYIDRTRNYMGDITGQFGLVALSSDRVYLIPSYALGYGVWASHYQQLGQATADHAKPDDKEAAFFTQHLVHDAGLQLLYALPSRTDGGSRFAMGVKVGYKVYRATNTLKTVEDNYTTDQPIGTRGAYVQLSLGMGLIRK